MYKEGNPGEIFIKMAKEGSTLSGFMDGLALSISIGLQYGVPLKTIVDKLTNTRFEPSGFTENPNIRYSSSVLDYIARWLGGKFISLDYLKPRTPLSEESGTRDDAAELVDCKNKPTVEHKQAAACVRRSPEHIKPLDAAAMEHIGTLVSNVKTSAEDDLGEEALI